MKEEREKKHYIRLLILFSAARLIRDSVPDSNSINIIIKFNRILMDMQIFFNMKHLHLKIIRK